MMVRHSLPFSFTSGNEFPEGNISVDACQVLINRTITNTSLSIVQPSKKQRRLVVLIQRVPLTMPSMRMLRKA